MLICCESEYLGSEREKMFIDMYLSVRMCLYVYLAMCVKGEFFSLNMEDGALWSPLVHLRVHLSTMKF